MAYDNVCKYLSEKYPESFANWLVGQATAAPVQVLKTELSIEPIRADSVTFLRARERIFHLEFQVKVPTDKPMPLRMLNYWVRLYWQYSLPITQVLIWLKSTTNSAVFENQFVSEMTQHRYQVVRIWEQSPEPLLQDPALLPLAILAASDDTTQLLSRVAEQVSNIEEPEQRQEIATCTQVLAGLRFRKNVIRNFFTRGIMRESVIFQEILEEGKQEEALLMVMRLLTRRFGTLAPEVQTRLGELSIAHLEDLAEALLDFSEAADVIAWLQEHQGM